MGARIATAPVTQFHCHKIMKQDTEIVIYFVAGTKKVRSFVRFVWLNVAWIATTPVTQLMEQERDNILSFVQFGFS